MTRFVNTLLLALLTILGLSGILMLYGTWLPIIGVGLVVDWVAKLVERLSSAGEAPLRFTGSQEMASFTGNIFPLTGEPAPVLDMNNWRLSITGAVNSRLSLDYKEILKRSSQVKTELLDCTSGWYSVQNWRGIPLVDLLGESGAWGNNIEGVRLASISGYHHTFPIEEARKILLATHVGGELLSLDHGFPLRAVVPSRRGWFWVKWLARVDVLDNPWEVIFGVMESPREVLRQWGK